MENYTLYIKVQVPGPDGGWQVDQDRMFDFKAKNDSYAERRMNRERQKLDEVYRRRYKNRTIDLKVMGVVCSLLC